MRTLSIDLGTRRVGLALSDEGGRFATPLEVLEVNGFEHALAQIVSVIKKEGVERVVLGLPLNMDDSFGPAARQTIRWGDQLARTCGKPLIYVDERLSSFDAEQALNQRKRGGEKLTRGKKKQRLDALAAAGFLQEFLDGKIAAIEVGPADQTL